MDKVNTFFKKYRESSYKKGVTILNPGDVITEVFLVQNGVVRLYTISRDGNETTFNLLKPGTYFSMLSILTDAPNDYYFEAMTNVVVLRAPKNEFLKFLKSEPVVLFDLTKRILSGVNGLLLTIENLTSGKAGDRVKTMLKILAKRFGKATDNNTLIDLPLTHQQIANLVGLTRETTSLEIEKLISKKIIKYEEHKIIILGAIPSPAEPLQNHSF